MDSSREGAEYSAAAELSTDGAAVARRAGVVGAATLTSRISGVGRDVVLAMAFSQASTDAFFIAFMIPNLFRRLVAEGSLTISFVPVFTTWLRRSREEARGVFNATWSLALIVGLGLSLAGILAADPLIDLFAPGFATDEAKHLLAVRLLRLCFPYILFMMLVSVAMGALNAVGHFLAPAIAPVLLNLSLIAGAGVGVLLIEPPIVALGGAVLVAGVLQVLLQVPSLRRLALSPRLEFAPRHEALGRLARLMGPAVLGASVFQLNLLVSRILASFLGDGAVSNLYYADRLLELPLGVFVFALGMASLPSFSRLAGDGNAPALRSAFEGTLGLALALALPATVGLVLLRVPIFAQIFHWNPATFDASAVQGCAAALLGYAVGLVPISVARVVIMLSVARENTGLPARGAVVGVAVNLAASLALIGPLPPELAPSTLVALQHRLVVADLGYAGLALAASIAAGANALYVWLAVGYRYGSPVGLDFVWRLARLATASAAMGLAVAASARLLPVPEAASLVGVVRLLAHVAVGVVTYGVALRVVRAPELELLKALLGRRQKA